MKKIAIIGHASDMCISALMAKAKDIGIDVEVIAPQNAPKDAAFEKPPIPIINMLPDEFRYNQPLTRRERRALARKKK